MKKEFFPNVEYNRRKRVTTITLNAALILASLCIASLFIIKQDIIMSVSFILIGLLPLLVIPQVIKNHPIKSTEPIMTITDKNITVLKETVDLKSVTSVKVIIELLPSRLDSENIKILNDMVNVYPGDEYYGNLDVYYTGEDGKVKTLYSHIEGVVGAMETLIELGVKNYTLSYSIKKNAVKSEFDFKGLVQKRVSDEANQASKKSKTKQLL